MEFTVGDLVTEYLTEQVGVVIQTDKTHPNEQYQVFWLIQGLSMWNEYAEWKDARSLEVVA
jgi:hypothetical protein